MRKFGKSLIAVGTAAVLLCTGCSSVEQPEGDEDIFANLMSTEEATEETTEVTTTVVTYDEVILEVPEITQEEVSIVLEAEDVSIPEYCAIAVQPRLGYSGTGYLSGISAYNGTILRLETEIPATQHYDITIVAGCSAECTCEIEANGETIYTLEMDEVDNFMSITIQGIFLQEGECTFSIEPTDGVIDVDCLEIVNNTSLYDEESAISESPVDPDASDGAVELYQFLTSQYGSKIISGQYVSSSDNTELEEIYLTTGKYPLIRFADVGAYTDGDTENATAVEDSLAWAEEGGVVGLIWTWNAPSGTEDVLAENTDFSLADAVTEEDVATCTLSELQYMLQAGTITEECYDLICDIDTIAEALEPLAEADVPVLWRPLMEAGGEWYWWGASGADAYIWLWDLLYTRMTEYHDLHNLLWVWNGQSESYLVDTDEFDIASLDLYVDETEDEFGSRYEQYVALSNMVSGKMFAMSECSTFPDINAIFRDNAVWSFFGLWYDTYFEAAFEDTENLISVYNSEAVLTREDYTP